MLVVQELYDLVDKVDRDACAGFVVYFYFAGFLVLAGDCRELGSDVGEALWRLCVVGGRRRRWSWVVKVSELEEGIGLVSGRNEHRGW